jgi:hypothetical protein
MTLPVWPATLPQQVFTDGYTAEGIDPNVRTPMEDGQPYVRRKVLTLWTPITVKVYLETVEQVTALKTFWRVTLNCGSKRFTMPVHTFDGPGYVSKTCLWDGPGPAYSPFDGADQPTATFKVKVLDF